MTYNETFELAKYLNFHTIILYLLINLVILFIVNAVYSSDEQFTKTVTVLFDLSASSLAKDYGGEEEELKKNIEAIPKIIHQLKPGTYFRVIGITEKSFSKPLIMVEGGIPTEQGFFKEKQAIAKLSLLKAWGKLTINANAQSSDIFGAINLASNLISEEDNSENILIILSDMRECGREFDLETPSYIDIKILDKVKERGLIPSLKGVKVWVLGVHTAGKTETYWQSLKNFWLQYFKEARANLVSYSIDRRWNYEQINSNQPNEN